MTNLEMTRENAPPDSLSLRTSLMLTSRAQAFQPPRAGWASAGSAKRLQLENNKLQQNAFKTNGQTIKTMIFNPLRMN